MYEADQAARSVAQLWLSHSSHDAEAIRLVASAGIPFVTLYASELAKPELLVGPDRFRGVEQIDVFVSHASR